VSTSFAPLTAAEGAAAAALSAAALSRQVRRRLDALVCDDSGVAAEGVAIYTLSDPRELRTVRYVGQTAAPRRRFLQHVRTARLWLPDELPWWVRSPRLRPLYGWIRELFAEEGRLPVMVVTSWVGAAQARVCERSLICACLERQQPLLNFEGELRRRQPLLL
jgi:hypothetical protein